MKLILQDSNNYILRFDKGEEVLAGLCDFAKQQGITAGAFSAIGACGSVDLGYFNPFLKDYRTKPFVEELEILSVSGNLALKDGQPAVHAHGCFARNDFTSFGGHVFKLVVSLTCEVFLTKLTGEMKRELDESMNLNLLV